VVLHQLLEPGVAKGLQATVRESCGLVGVDDDVLRGVVAVGEQAFTDEKRRDSYPRPISIV
jgi:hypothetical protein